MTSTNSDEIKSVSNTTDSEIQDRRKKIQNFIYSPMPKRKNELYDKCDKIKIATNLFDLQFKDKFHNLTLFKIEVNPPFEENNYFLRRKIYNYIEANFPKNFKKNFFGGNVLFSFIFCENEKEKNNYEKIIFKEKINEKDYEITLTKIKEVKFKDINDFNGENQRIKLYIETIIRNIVMKHPDVIYFKDRTLFEINRENIIKVSDNKENIYRGYMTSANITENGLFVLINNINKVISGKTVLEKMKELEVKYNGLSIKEIEGKIKEYFQNHKTVLTTYGVPRTYKIKDIHFDIKPKELDITIKDKNNINQKSTTITLFNYYKNQYNKEINENQPIIEAEPKKKKKNSDKKNNNNPSNEEEYIIYLIPELLYLTGNEDENTISKRRERNLNNKTRINPNQKMELINGFLNLYNSTNKKKIEKGNKTLNLKSPKELADEWGVKLGNNLAFQGRILLPPILYFKDINNSNSEKIGLTQAKIDSGIFKPGIPIRINNFTEEDLFFLYDNNDSFIHKYNLFFKLCEKFSIKGFKKFEVNKVLKIGLNYISKWENIADELRKLPLYNNKKKFGILFCSRNLEKYYDKLKDYFVQKFNIPTQHLNTAKLEERIRDINSVLFNLVDQINVKMGGMNYYIDFKTPSLIGPEEKFMIIGLDSKSYKNHIIYSMTSSKHPKLNLFIAQEKTVNKKIKQEKEDALKNMFKNAILELKMESKNISPDYILLYRQGGNEYYNKSLAVDELYLFKEVLNNLRKINENNPSCNYKNTKFYYICCNLKSDLKFFEEKSNKDYINPLSGLVVDEFVTRNNKYEFYLQPQFVNQGTATPSHYQVMYYDQENNNLEMERLQKLTFYLTYYYWNWHGAIRIPAILKFSTTALDFYSKCLNPEKQIGEFKFDKPYFI